MSLNSGPFTPRTEGGIRFFKSGWKSLSLIIRFMRLFTIIFLLFLPIAASAQSAFDIGKLSDEGRAILAKIERDNSVPSDTMGMRFEYLPKDYPLTVLREKLEMNELVMLTKHNNPIVRCYAFKAITMVSEEEAFQILPQHFHDTAQVYTHAGCFGKDVSVGDFFVGVFKGWEMKRIDSTYLRALDSLLIFTPNQLMARSYAMQAMKPDNRYYARVREIVTSERDFGALIGLAKFRRTEDIHLIMTTVVDGRHWIYGTFPYLANLQAIREFPNPEFLSFLELHLEEVLNNDTCPSCMLLYYDIAAIGNREAQVLLSRPFLISDANIRPKHLIELGRALRMNKNPVYDSLRKRLQEEIGN
jgi:hypothetical protein